MDSQITTIENISTALLIAGIVIVIISVLILVRVYGGWSKLFKRKKKGEETPKEEKENFVKKAFEEQYSAAEDPYDDCIGETIPLTKNSKRETVGNEKSDEEEQTTLLQKKKNVKVVKKTVIIHDCRRPLSADSRDTFSGQSGPC